ncbi:hypothetical protein ACW9KT_00005 [Hymenobacter sp. HD11105]
MPTDSYTQLVAALRLLAAPAEEQCQYYPPYVVADEITLDYDDALLLLTSAPPPLPLTTTIYTALIELDQALYAMSSVSDLWTVEALAHSPRWNHLRRQAAAILALLADRE